MRVIGLTGGIASGKSLVSQLLAERGAVILDADKLGHESYRRGTATFDTLVREFGPDVAGPDGEIDRRALGAKVFAEPGAMRKLNAIVWPAIKQLARERIEALRGEGVPVVVLEAAVLIEAEWFDLADEVWLVEVSPETARRRLAERNGLSAEEANKRIAAQLTNEQRRPYAQVVIENNGSLDELHRAVDAAWSALQAQVAAT
jgi:dephospho-CoA kinase